MIEPTDASKCDERQVKNKPKPLAHKKKGATHIMGIQGMKTWKLGAFFVISLMLVAGLLVDTASAQHATVTVRPSSGDTGAVLDSVSVEYRITTAIPGTQDQLATPTPATDDDTAITNAVTIELPSDWTAGVGGDFGTLAAARTGQTEGVWTSRDVASPGDSYIEVDVRLGTGATVTTAPTISTNAVTLTVTGSANGGMRVNDRIIVTYYKAMVHPLTAEEITALETMPHVEHFSVSEDTNLRTTPM